MSSISVVIPYFNGGKTLPSAVLSIESQIYKPSELIIVDDGSIPPLEHSDVPKCSFPIEIIRTDNRGQSHARNTGASAAKAKFIAFLDQDDEFKPNHLSSVVKQVSEKNKFIFTDFDVLQPSGRLVPSFRSQIARLGELGGLKDSLDQDLYILPSCLLVEAETFSETGGFNSNLRGYEDDDLILRLIQSGIPGKFVEKSTVTWIQSKGSSSNDLTMNSSRKLFTLIWLHEQKTSLHRSKLIGRLFLPLAKRLFSSGNRLATIREFKAVVMEIKISTGMNSFHFINLTFLGLVQVLFRNLLIRFRSFSSLARGPK